MIGWRVMAGAAGAGGALSVSHVDADGSFTGAAASHTYTMDFGAASADRVLVAVISGRNTGITGATVTIGGVSATVDVARVSSLSLILIARAAVPSGTSGDVVTTWTGASSLFAQVSLFRITGGAVAVADSGSADTTVTVDAPAGGVVIAGGMAYRTTAPLTASWSGVVEDTDSYVVSGTFHFTQSTGSALTEGGTVTPAVTWNATPSVPNMAAVTYQGA